jgi:hypothetical protein
MAGSHNAMATTDDDFLFANQRIGMAGQLALGIRAMLLDLWPGARTDAGYVRTDLAHVADYELAQQDMTERQRNVTEGLLAMAGAAYDPDRREVYLCHLACERGATKAVDAFRAIESWLRENPNNVIVLVLEDHVDGAAAIKVLQQSGLAKRAFAWNGRSQLPTLRELIEAKTNVLVMAERHGGGAPWYHKAWEGLLQDTTYKAGSPSELDCGTDRMRGTRGSPLLLANHWLNRSDTLAAADLVNTREALKARYEGCKSERRQDVNILAADFVDRGDLIKSVRELNGVAAPEPMLASAPTTGK